MAKHGKKHRKTQAEVEARTYEFEEAILFLKEHSTASFDETIEMALVLGVDPRKSDQAVRGTTSLPHGTGKTVRVVVFATGDAADAAREAGADRVGFEDLVAEVAGGMTDFDVAVATPEAMKEVRKLGRVLGPRGLMPNPKTGTVTDDTAAAVAECKAGRVEFRMDRQGDVHIPFGKASFEVQHLVENGTVVYAAVKAQRPASGRGVFIKRCTISSTMGVGLRVEMKADEAL